MNQTTLVFRQAELEDIQGIWQLLHADSRMRSEAYIREHLTRIYVLYNNRRILGALCGIPRIHKLEIAWVVVHPFYPEQAVAEMMIRGFQGIYYRCYPGLEQPSLLQKMTRRLLTALPETP